MSRVDELVVELCPDGVEYVALGNLLKYEQPTKYLVPSATYNDSFKTPVLTAGKTFVLGYTNETHGIYEASVESPVIIFDDFTTAFKWVDFPFKAKSSAMKLLTPRVEAGMVFKFVNYVMQTIQYQPQEHSRQWISRYSKFRVPVPPREIQNEIVRILDKFTQLEAELEAELEARRQQYEYYRDTLLTFTEGGPKGVPFRTLGDVVKIRNGKDHKKLADGAVPVYGSGGVMRLADQALFSRPSVLIPRKGSLSNLFYVDVPFWTVDTIFYTEIDTSLVIEKFLYYWLTMQRLERLNTAGGVPSLTQTVLNRVIVPTPPLKVQRKIVSILDKFDTLINDLSVGIPAEIEARRQQYEHYRDTLLTFDEKPAEKKTS